ncbi:hypothetical protein [Rhizobium sp. CF142]|uniref:hypothetical protein n=1 Tax=Rhizobium sp. CF142 TaxID=1144314 RepID=UPI00026EEDBC|nr:hypothetical protein [Rhizobium sp. CF142]EJJ27749.1 hypothetical protein PMI11_03932 [Rhizobium sp. CF142]
MTLREKILEIITQALTADETILPQEELDNITDIILRADELSTMAAEIFGDTGRTFISEIVSLFARLPLATPLKDVFPKATNVVAFLNLANQLDPDELVEEVPTELGTLFIREAALEAFSKSGDRLKLFVYEHPTNFNESVALLDFSSGLEVGPNSANFPQAMAACVAIKVGLETVDLTGKRWIVSSVQQEQRRLYYCKYHVLLAGHLLTNPVFAPSTLALQGIAETLRTAEEYNQFNEPFEILGEINSRTTVLDTLLSCYHVLENYMIRAQIAKVVGRNNASTLFGIRNFKQMEIAVEKKEMAHLSQLISESWQKQIGIQTFRDYVRDRFDALFHDPAFVADDFHDFMEKLTVKPNGQRLNLANLNDACDLLPKLLYQIRCSIVHNKETEFHLSNRELNVATVLMTLVDLCLPAMQRLAFGLPSVPAPNPLLYSRPALMLY